MLTWTGFHVARFACVACTLFAAIRGFRVGASPGLSPVTAGFGAEAEGGPRAVHYIDWHD